MMIKKNTNTVHQDGLVVTLMPEIRSGMKRIQILDEVENVDQESIDFPFLELGFVNEGNVEEDQ